MSDLYAKLRAAYSSKDDAVPKGYKSRREWQAEWKLGEAQTRNLLSTGVRNGILVRANLKIGRAIVPHYGPAKKR